MTFRMLNAAAARAHGADPLTDYRTRLALEQSRAAELRAQDRAEQSSLLNPPGVRIRAWEKVHGVRLPTDPAHPILPAVARTTDLTLDQVHEEQRNRAGPR